LEWRNADRPWFDLQHVAYYFGALVVISDMTWFITLGWERFGGGGILAISLSYALGFTVAGGLLWRDKGLQRIAVTLDHRPRAQGYLRGSHQSDSSTPLCEMGQPHCKAP